MTIWVIVELVAMLEWVARRGRAVGARVHAAVVFVVCMSRGLDRYSACEQNKQTRQQEVGTAVEASYDVLRRKGRGEVDGSLRHGLCMGWNKCASSLLDCTMYMKSAGQTYCNRSWGRRFGAESGHGI